MSVRYEPLSIAFAVIAAIFTTVVAGGMLARPAKALLIGKGNIEAGDLVPLLFGAFVLAWIAALIRLGRRDLRALIQFTARTLGATSTHGVTSRLNGPA